MLIVQPALSTTLRKLATKVTLHNLRSAGLEETLCIISPCQGGTVEHQTPNLWLHSQIPKSLSYPAVHSPKTWNIFIIGLQLEKYHSMIQYLSICTLDMLVKIAYV